MKSPGTGGVDEFVSSMEDELRRIARLHLRRLRRNLAADGLCPTIETMGLINEAYLKLRRERKAFANHGHFAAIASLSMRQICDDYARRQRAQRRRGAAFRVPLGELQLAVPGEKPVRAEALAEALRGLEALEPRLARIVQLKFYGGLTSDEIAETLGVSERTVKRDWQAARLWLYREIEGAEPR